MSGLLDDSHCTCKYLYIIIFLHQQAFEEAAKRLKMDEEDRKKMVSKRTSFCPVNMFTIWKYLGWHCFELFVAWFCYIYTESEKHPLIRRAWPLFWKWVADNNKTTKQSLQSKDSHCLRKTSWSLSLFLSWLSHNAILHSWWSFSLSCNSFF